MPALLMMGSARGSVRRSVLFWGNLKP